ncbi:hypothetical protein [Pseudomonas fluorescens]|uniref:hypothetical protein n=1 Tax=Pseudomonas TaxID=286 RepID=UPI003CFCCB48
MKRIVAVISAMLLSACVNHRGFAVTQQSAPPDANAIEDLRVVGPQTAKNLTDRYNNVPKVCRTFSPGTVFECSGVILRGTSHSTQYHSWDPNPSPTVKGVSASYVRQDSRFRSMYIYKNGFIFYAKRDAPADKKNIDILCFFPRDGATNDREDQGCGQSSDGPTSRECQSQGITTAEQWVVHYKEHKGYGGMCGFNVRDALGEHAVSAINEGLKAQGLIFEDSFNDYNEIRLAKWEQGIGKVLPLQAFFYFNAEGKAVAQYDQKDFLTQTGISRPIIYIIMPVSPSDQAMFKFIEEDQAIPLDRQRG